MVGDAGAHLAEVRASAERRDRPLREVMGRVFGAASQALHRTVVEEGVGMGTTLTVAAFAGDAIVVGPVGDCRLYRVRRGRLQVITHDHSLASAHLELGLLTLEVYRRSPLRNVLYQCLGPQESVTPDVVVVGLEDDDVLALREQWLGALPPACRRPALSAGARRRRQVAGGPLLEDGVQEVPRCRGRQGAVGRRCEQGRAVRHFARRQG